MQCLVVDRRQKLRQKASGRTGLVQLAAPRPKAEGSAEALRLAFSNRGASALRYQG
jgi:hypothetical protein